VLLLEVPRLLRDILEHTVETAAGCDLAAADGVDDVGALWPPPDVVILGLTSGSDTTLVSALLGRWPGAQVLTVMQEGGETIAYELRRDRRVLGPMAPHELVGALRDAVRLRRVDPGRAGQGNHHVV
jgi:hypothetical protein